MERGTVFIFKTIKSPQSLSVGKWQESEFSSIEKSIQLFFRLPILGLCDKIVFE